MRKPTRSGVVAAALASMAAFAPCSALAEDVKDCAVWDATYKLSATLRITDTPSGAGDGSHKVGPGTLVLRFDVSDPAQPARVELRAFELHQHFSIEPKAVFWSGKVVTDALARATPDSDGVIARGAVSGSTLQWTSQVHGYRSDGAVNCTGSLCGNFGAPPPGSSPTHTPVHDVRFEPLRFGASGLTFDMGFAVVSRAASPRQTTLLQLGGRAASWVCVRPRADPHSSTRRWDSGVLSGDRRPNPGLGRRAHASRRARRYGPTSPSRPRF
jgi:hypothetical protein